MKTLIQICLCVCLLTKVNAQCISNDSNIYSFSYSNTLYTLVKENKNWADADSCAKLMKSYLAVINNDAEMQKINDAIKLNANIDFTKTVAPDGGGASYVWLGGTDSKVEGDWVWNVNNNSTDKVFYRGTYPSGLPIGGAYVYWGQEPDNFLNLQDALGLAITDWPLGTVGHWNDLNPSNQLYYLIETPLLGNAEISIESKIQLYPNPACDKLTIELPYTSMMFNVSISEITGKSISIEQQIHSTTQIDLDALESGIYFIKLTSTDNSISINRKFQIVK